MYPHKPGESGQGSVDVRPLGNMPSSPELQKKMAGDRKPAVAVPLTNGFARTGYEQDQAAAQKIEAGRH